MTVTVINSVLATFASYVLVCNSLRYLRRNRKHAELPFKTRDDFSKMTPDDAYKIIEYCTTLEFPFLSTKALEFALFKTYGIPTISKLLCQTQQLSHQDYASRRYADTNVLIAEFLSHAPTSDRATAAIARMNYLHGRYQKANKISNQDMLYTLALFVLEIERWIGLYEWRSLTPMEICAFGTLWKSIGDAMGISFDDLAHGPNSFKDGYEFFQDIKVWADAYEEKHMVPSPYNHQLAEETTRILIYAVPAFLVPHAKHIVATLMGDRLRTAMLYEKPLPLYYRLTWFILTARKYFIRYLMPPRPYVFRSLQISETADPKTGKYHRVTYAMQPWYVKAGFWERNSPAAWIRWATGRAYPDGEHYKPDGYNIFDIGPATLEGKGIEECTKTMNHLKETRGGCPFAFK